MKKCSTISQLVAAVFFLALSGNLESAIAQTATWPRFRGPNSTGIAAPDADPPIVLDSKNILWKTPLPIGHSSPCIWGNSVFITGYVEEKKELQLICLNRSTGAVEWIYAVQPEKIEPTHISSNPAVTTPSTDGEIVCVYFGSYGILCVNLQGALQWEHRIPTAQTAVGVATSPIITNGQIIFAQFSSDETQLMALNLATGDSVWATQLPAISAYGSDNHSTPVVWNNQIILHRKGEIVAHSVESGERLWWVLTETTGVSTPVVEQDMIFVGGWSNLGEESLRVPLPDFKTFLEKFDVNNDSLIAKEEIPEDMFISTRPEIPDIQTSQVRVKDFGMWVFDSDKDDHLSESEWARALGMVSSWSQDTGLLAIRPGGSGNVTHTNIAWFEGKAVPEVPSPIFVNGYVYMIKNGGLLTCLNARNGELVFRKRLGAPGPYNASPVAANGRIYLPSGRGIITVIAATNEFEILAQNRLNEEIFATPAIVNDNIYVRTTEALYAFGN